LWSFGDDESVLLILVYMGFAAWNTYDIIDLKLSNTLLLNGTENSWGFGQVLPVVLLALLLLATFDAAESESSSIYYTSPRVLYLISFQNLSTVKESGRSTKRFLILTPSLSREVFGPPRLITPLKQRIEAASTYSNLPQFLPWFLSTEDIL
jgi:hypothetical protein